MRIRLPLALLALIGLTAFAPAPFLKPDRKPSGDSALLQRMQGTWSITAKQRMGPDGVVNYSTRQKVHIEKDQWEFLSTSAKAPKAGAKGPPARAKKVPSRIGGKIVLDDKGAPRPFRFKRALGREDADYMVGILAFEGNKLRILYRLGTVDEDIPPQPPNGFLTIPQGWYLLTLERDD
jgi:uncharacterized protein (TIGR03067 family)